MEEMNNTMMDGGQMGGKKKGSGALVGSIIIIIIIIIGGIYMFKNAKMKNAETMTTDEVAGELDMQSEGDDLADIEADINATNLEGVVPETGADEAAQ